MNTKNNYDQVVKLVADLRNELENHSAKATFTVRELSRILDICLAPATFVNPDVMDTNGEFNFAYHNSRSKS